MTNLKYTINSRELTAFSELSNEFTYHPDKNYLFDLSFLTAIEVVGSRASEFLQGQLSCDLREVTQQQMRQGVFCNLQGRILALVDVINWSDHSFYLILPEDLRARTQTSLEKIAMLSRIVLEHATNYQLFGLYLQQPADILPGNFEPLNQRYQFSSHKTSCWYYLGDNLYVLLVNQKEAPEYIDLFNQHQQWRGSLAWHKLRLTQKSLQIYPESRGLFLPHRLGLHTSGYLSFNKGCYKGQEIIARTHYRAKLKHELRIFRIKTEEPLFSGQRIFNIAGDIEIGELVDFCPLDHHNFLIAVSVVFEHPLSVRLEKHTARIELVPDISM